jgi:hypothetical protein
MEGVDTRETRLQARSSKKIVWLRLEWVEMKVKRRITNTIITLPLQKALPLQKHVFSELILAQLPQ